jgi:RNA-splicing ligase RtcB
VITHLGSRGLAAQLYQRGLKAAIQATKALAVGEPENAAWLPYESEEGQDYWEALQYVSRWTASQPSDHSSTLSS